MSSKKQVTEALFQLNARLDEDVKLFTEVADILRGAQEKITTKIQGYLEKNQRIIDRTNLVGSVQKPAKAIEFKSSTDVILDGMNKEAIAANSSIGSSNGQSKKKGKQRSAETLHLIQRVVAIVATEATKEKPITMQRITELVGHAPQRVIDAVKMALKDGYIAKGSNNLLGKNRKVWFYPNEKKQAPKKEHVRPNYGIGQGIRMELNKYFERNIKFKAIDVLTDILPDFPNALMVNIFNELSAVKVKDRASIAQVGNGIDAEYQILKKLPL